MDVGLVGTENISQQVDNVRIASVEFMTILLFLIVP